jgi:hypothetical protein
MRSILGKLILAPVMMAAAALATSSAMAAESTVNVPFKFTAAGKTWPAGSYVIEKDIRGTMVTVKSKVNSLSFTCLIGPGEPAPTDLNVTLKFDELGPAYVLRTVQYGALITSRLDRNASHAEYLTSSGR